MARIPSLNRTLSSTIPFARGVADRAVSTAGPIVVDVVGRVASRLPRRARTHPTTNPETFAPSPVADEPVAEPVAEPMAEPAVTAVPDATEQPGAPSPATVARNVAGPRPTAKSPARRKPPSVPGAKLPVTRPST